MLNRAPALSGQKPLTSVHQLEPRIMGKAIDNARLGPVITTVWAVLAASDRPLTRSDVWVRSGVTSDALVGRALAFLVEVGNVEVRHGLGMTTRYNRAVADHLVRAAWYSPVTAGELAPV
jgi:hypothetical protein